MNKTVQTVLTVFCALMILTLPFLVPSPKLLESAVDRILEEAPAEADEAGSLLDWLFGTEGRRGRARLQPAGRPDPGL